MSELLTGGMYDNLFQLVVHGPREAGEIPSKAALGDLIANKWVGQKDDRYIATSEGIKTLLAQYERVVNPHHSIFGAVYIESAEICGGGKLDGKPLVVLGGALAWAMEHLLGSKLKFSSSFGAYDYATFDYLDLDGNTWLMKPGDWLILSEDHKHTLHRFTADE